MTVTQLIAELQRLNHEHFCALKEITPMGQVPNEPEIFLETFDEEGNFSGYTKDFDIVLDLQTGIQFIAM